MCVVPSWIGTKDAILFLTDKDVLAHGIEWKDSTGHSAIRKVFPGAKGKDCEGLGKHTPQVVVDALLGGRMRQIAEAGDLGIIDGERTFNVGKVSGSVNVRQGATFTAPKLAKSGSVNVEQGGTFNAPKLKSRGTL